MKEKKKVIPTKVKMPEQSPRDRIKNFSEVPLGYSKEQALEEAKRCLQCKEPKCREGCPVGVDIPGFISLMAEGNFDAAISRIKEVNYLPAICGRVCPQDEQCEKLCTLRKKYEPVAIQNLERFAADYERNKGIKIPEKAKPTGRKVAIAGSGPAGLTCAAYLAKYGHEVTIFEALHDLGGVLVYGIPAFRLPRDVIRAEIDSIKKLGVEIKTDVIVGNTLSVEDLFKMGYSSVFVATGAGLPSMLNIPGENLDRIYSANEFLIRINLMKANRFPEYDTPIKIGNKVAVIGGGNVAMDSARCALRMGAKNVFILYRRTEKEMPARQDEVVHAREEGIQFNFLVAPTRFIGDTGVSSIECIRMKLGEPDESGRRRPVPIEGSQFSVESDTVVVAVGQSPNPIVPSTTPGLRVGKWGEIIVDGNYMTSIKGVYAGGDITTGGATVISAMGAGKVAANAIHKYLMGLP